MPSTADLRTAWREDRVASVHIQKCAGGVATYQCSDRCVGIHKHMPREEVFNSIIKAGWRCNCFARFDSHFGLHEWLRVRAAASAGGVHLALITMLRDPVERVISEFAYLRALPEAMLQDQWDYADEAQRPLRDALANGSLSFVEFVEHPLNPAHNRQVRALAGRGPPKPWNTSGCCLSQMASGHLRTWAHRVAGGSAAESMGRAVDELRSDAFAASRLSVAMRLAVRDEHAAVAIAHLEHSIEAFGIVERMEESVALMTRVLGWPNASSRLHINEARTTKPTVTTALRARIAELNGLDTRLYSAALALFDSRQHHTPTRRVTPTRRATPTNAPTAALQSFGSRTSLQATLEAPRRGAHATFVLNETHPRRDVFWHTTLGTLVPLLATMLDAGTCGPCTPRAACQCAPATLRMAWEPPSILRAQLQLLPHLDVHVVRASELYAPAEPTGTGELHTLAPRQDSCEHGTVPRWHELKRCMSGVHNASVLLRARRVLGALCSLDLENAKPRTAHGWVHAPQYGDEGDVKMRALIVLRCGDPSASPSPKLETGRHPHHGMCLNETHGTYKALASELRVHGVATRGLAFESLSFCEQLAAVAEADMIIYAHGSAHANFLALTAETTVVELTPYFANATRACMRCADCMQSTNANCLLKPPLAPTVYDLIVGRSQSKRLVAALGSGVPNVQHLAVPAAMCNGCQRSDWGCAPPKQLARLSVARHLAMVGRHRAADAVLAASRTAWVDEWRNAQGERCSARVTAFG